MTVVLYDGPLYTEMFLNIVPITMSNRHTDITTTTIIIIIKKFLLQNKSTGNYVTLHSFVFFCFIFCVYLYDFRNKNILVQVDIGVDHGGGEMGEQAPQEFGVGGLSPQILSCCKIFSTRLLALQCRKMCFFASTAGLL